LRQRCLSDLSVRSIQFRRSGLLRLCCLSSPSSPLRRSGRLHPSDLSRRSILSDQLILSSPYHQSVQLHLHCLSDLLNPSDLEHRLVPLRR
jgi:hypothetical protein